MECAPVSLRGFRPRYRQRASSPFRPDARGNFHAAFQGTNSQPECCAPACLKTRLHFPPPAFHIHENRFLLPTRGRLLALPASGRSHRHRRSSRPGTRFLRISNSKPAFRQVDKRALAALSGHRIGVSNTQEKNSRPRSRSPRGLISTKENTGAFIVWRIPRGDT